jgi:hypothetical protein
VSLSVELYPDMDPRVFVFPGGEDVTYRVQSITILPHRMAQARLLALRDGKPYVLPGSEEMATETHFIVQIKGDWVSNILRPPGITA